jgi:ABC-type dipeptide/oligopeptide/nickel transport system permease subunit/ABC-type transport system substrate-binding protein
VTEGGGPAAPRDEPLASPGPAAAPVAPGDRQAASAARHIPSALGDSAAWRRFRANRPAVFGVWLVALLFAFAALGPLLIPHSPIVSDFSLTRAPGGGPPGASWRHWLGTDVLFRDVLARLAHGARLSLGVALAATALSTFVGAAVGLIAGWYAGTRAGLIDAVLMRLVDVLLALPFLLLVTAIGVAVGRADVGTILLVLGLTGWTGTARLVRAKTLQVRELDFVTAARALGAGPVRIVLRHVLPNVASTLIVVATSSVAAMIVAEGVLGYLTVGVSPPQPSWGRMLHEAETYLGVRPALVAAPGFAILLAVLGWNRIGEGLRDALDPRSARTPVARRLPADLLITAAALLLVAVVRPTPIGGPIGSERPLAEPVRGGWLHLASYGNLRALEPAVAYDDVATMLNELVLGHLLSWDEGGQLVPDLARSWSVSADGKTLRFDLREGVRFHDGAELTAADVKRSLERTLHAKTPCPAASLYERIAGFADWHAGKAPELAGVRVTGRHQVEIELTAPDATFPALLSMHFAAPVCPSSGSTVDMRAPALPCGTGPFRMERFDPEGEVRLRRFDGYHQPGRPYLDGIEWVTGVRSITQRYKFERGELDLVTELSSTDSGLFAADPRWAPRARWVPKLALNAIYLNTQMAPFDNRHLRRAVAFAVDPTALEKVRADLTAIDRVLPAGIPGPSRDVPMRRHDLGAALAEMERAGFPFDPVSGRGGYPAKIDYLTVPDTFEQGAAEIYQQQLARVGIRIELRLVTYATYAAESTRRGQSPMGWAAWRADFPDASNFFEPTLSSKAIDDESSGNRAFFSNAELDRVLEEAHGERDLARRFAGYQRAEEIIRDEAPWVPTHAARSLQLWHPYVRGYAPHPVLPLSLAGVWIDAAARDAGGVTGLRVVARPLAKAAR